MRRSMRLFISLTGVSVLFKSLPIAAAFVGGVYFLFPSLSPNDIAKAVILPMLSAYIVIRLVDAGLAAVVPPGDPRDDEQISDSEMVALWFLTFGALALLVSGATAIAYRLADFEEGVELALMVALVAGFVVVSSVVALFRGGVKTKKPLDQAHDMIHSRFLFSHVGKQCHRRHAA